MTILKKSDADQGRQGCVLVCREGVEADLAQESQARVSGSSAWTEGQVSSGAGFVSLSCPVTALPRVPFVFERQRIPNAQYWPRESTRPLTLSVVRSMLGDLGRSDRTWTIHTFVAGGGSKKLLNQAQGLEKMLLRLCEKEWPEASRRYRRPGAMVHPSDGDVLQLMRTQEGLWSGAGPLSVLTDTCPGGLHRMKMDGQAPSRSYLKMEEALDRMGVQIRSGERVLDFGAAPGGWTWSFLKRGCRVTAIDRGPMRCDAASEGCLVHLREDGMVWRPPREEVPVDWLVSDMLIPSGKAMGLLRRWIGGGWARRYVINLKLPQSKPWPVVEKHLEYVHGVPGFEGSIRQLYHDRREVTLMGGFVP